MRWLVFTLFISCAHAEPLRSADADAGANDCEICWAGCRDPKDEIAAYHCAWHCNEVCFDERGDGGAE